MKVVLAGEIMSRHFLSLVLFLHHFIFTSFFSSHIPCLKDDFPVRLFISLLLPSVPLFLSISPSASFLLPVCLSLLPIHSLLPLIDKAFLTEPLSSFLSSLV